MKIDRGVVILALFVLLVLLVTLMASSPIYSSALTSPLPTPAHGVYLPAVMFNYTYTTPAPTETPRPTLAGPTETPTPRPTLARMD